MFLAQVSEQKIKATFDKGAVYNIGNQKDVEKKLVELTRTSKIEDAWLYDGKRLVDIGYRETEFLKDPRGNTFVTTNYSDIKKNAVGQERVTLYHLHQANPDNPTYLFTPQDIEFALKTKSRLKKDGMTPKFEYKMACPDGIYSLTIDAGLMKAYVTQKDNFVDYVLVETTKKEFEIINGRDDKARFFKSAREMSLDDKEELRAIQLSALESIGIKVIFEKIN